MSNRTLTGCGDLPDLLDSLTIVVTTLEAIGAERYFGLYLHVVGCTDNAIERRLCIEGESLTIGPPGSNIVMPDYFEGEFEANRRALLLADLCYILKTWRWSAGTTAGYLGCSEGFLCTCIGRSTNIDVPILPNYMVLSIKRLIMIDEARCLAGISDRALPAWLNATRPFMDNRTIQEVLLNGDPREFNQLLLWTLNVSSEASTTPRLQS